MRKPDFFIIGAPKCGTTALAAYLASHPNIQMSHPKEPHYFCKDLNAGGLPIASDEEYLARFFPGLSENRVLAAGEASVWYLYSEVAVPSILRFNPEAKFLVMVRNPVDMAFSLYSQFSFMGWEDAKNFMSAWELQSDREYEVCTPKQMPQDQRFLLYRQVCALGQQLRRLYGWVPREQVKVIVYDDFSKNTKQVYQEILQFVRVPDNGRSEFPRINAGRKIRNHFLVSFLRSRALINCLIAFKKSLNLKTLGFGRPDLPMPVQVRYRLIREFSNEISLLEELMGRDLAIWRQA